MPCLIQVVANSSNLLFSQIWCHCKFIEILINLLHWPQSLYNINYIILALLILLMFWLIWIIQNWKLQLTLPMHLKSHVSLSALQLYIFSCFLLFANSLFPTMGGISSYHLKVVGHLYCKCCYLATKISLYFYLRKPGDSDQYDSLIDFPFSSSIKGRMAQRGGTAQRPNGVPQGKIQPFKLVLLGW